MGGWRPYWASHFWMDRRGGNIGDKRNMANRYADPFCFQSVVSAGRHGVHEEVWRLENASGGLGMVCPSSSAIVEGLENARVPKVQIIF
jgi:hypothetical protein